MDAELENKYFEWLYSHIEKPNLDYWSLARILFRKEFIWFVANDDNRVEDGRELRYEFSYETNTKLTPEWHSFGVSMLEMLIALSRRLSFQADGEPRDWFWELMANLDLVRFSDRYFSERDADKIDQILDRVIWRTYSYSGDGGLFPLENPDRDQRHVEIWYQMNAYVISTF
jgi:hypothetical protein